MKRKIISLTLLTATVLLLLTACLVTPQNSGGEKEQPSDSSYAFFIKDASDTEDYTELLKSLEGVLGYALAVYNDSGSSAGSEIIVGNTGRDITASAKSDLSAKLSSVTLASDRDVAAGYIIYAKDDSLAVYWSHSYAKDLAFNALVTLLSDKNAKIEDGCVSFDAFSLLTRANEDKVISDAAKWAAIEETSPETAAALREALNFYEIEKIRDYFAQLYDPSTGAFYYSVSARDYDGFLPDIESTSQILRYIRENGYLTGYESPMTAYPEDMQEGFISFTQSLQSAEDGYFYHPQWGTDIKTQRLGRDQNNALVVLKMFGAKPLYSTGNDRLEGNFDEDDFEVSYKSDNAITAPLGGSAVVAVSKVIATAATDSRFESLESFMAWVNETVEGKTSHTFGHAFSSSGAQINAAGYMDELLDYLDAMQAEVFETQMAAHLADPENNPEPSGLWQPEKDYTSMSGCFKIVGMYNSYGREIDEKYIPYMVKAAVEAINIPVEAHYTDYPLKQMVYIYNPWAGLGRVFINMNKYNAELYEDMIAITRVNAPDMIYNTVRKLNLFRREDGSFSYFVEGAAATTQGVSVCLGLSDEGDVNATALAFGMYRDMFETLGYEYVEPYGNEDFDEFIDICQSMLPPQKISLTSGDPYEFNDVPYALTTSLKGGGTGEIVDDPITGVQSVYRFATVAGTGESVIVKAHGTSSLSNCYVFEADLCLYENNDYEIPFSIRLGNTDDNTMFYRFELVVSGDTVSVVDKSGDGKSAISTPLNVSAKFGQWFNIRIEYYKTEDGPRIKVYQDDKYVGYSENFVGAEVADAVPADDFKNVTVWGMKAATASLLIDNLTVLCENKEYVHELVVNEYDFENGAGALAPSGTNLSMGVVTDPTNADNHMLSLSATDKSVTKTGYLDLLLSAQSPASVTKTLSFDWHIPSVDNNVNGVYNEIAGDLFHATDYSSQIIMKYSIYTGTAEVLRLVAVANVSGSISDSYNLYLYETQGTKEVAVATIATDLEYDTTYDFSVELDFSDGEQVIVYCGGDELLCGDYILKTDDGNGGTVSAYVPEGGIMIKITQLKRFIGAVYHDNVRVEFSEELAE